MKSQIQHFNFQRDEILRKVEKIEPYAHFCFNSQREMGFYATQRSICKMINCFNYQRDGILPLQAPARA